MERWHPCPLATLKAFKSCLFVETLLRALNIKGCSGQSYRRSSLYVDFAYGCWYSRLLLEVRLTNIFVVRLLLTANTIPASSH